jgi:uncharacterized RDD family membrane protein YckC
MTEPVDRRPQDPPIGRDRPASSELPPTRPFDSVPPASTPPAYGHPAPPSHRTPPPAAPYGAARRPPADGTVYPAGEVAFGPQGAALPAYAPGSLASVQPHAAAPGAPTWAAAYPHFRLVTPGGRLASVLLDFLLMTVTLLIGWVIWTLIVWANGQTPGKQLLGHVVADVSTGRPFGWGQMFVREFAVRGLLFTMINMLTFGIFGIIDGCLVFSEDHRTLHDRMAASVVRYGA